MKSIADWNCLRAVTGLILAMSASWASGATLTAGSDFNVTTTYSSTGSPCETDCWEVWSSNGGLGQFMVVKDSSGYVTEAGRITEAYFADLFATVDEANRKIPISQRITRNGVVRVTQGGAPCSFSCAFTVDFGYIQDAILVLNGSGKIGAADQLNDANPVSSPSDTGSPPPGWAVCGQAKKNCVAPVGGVFQDNSGVYVTEWIEYDSQGNEVFRVRVGFVSGVVRSRTPIGQ